MKILKIKNLYLIFIFFIAISCSKEYIPQKYSLKVSSDPEIGGSISPTSNSFSVGSKITLIAKATPDYFFKQWKGDLNGSLNPADVMMNSDKSITGIFEKKSIISINLLSPPDTLMISKKYTFKIDGVTNNGEHIDLTSKVTITASKPNVTILPDNFIIPYKSGSINLVFTYGNLVANYSGVIYEIEDAFIDPNLKLSNGKLKIPVIILRLMPTSDGVTLNEKIGPDSYWNYNYPTLDIVKQKFNDDNLITKNAMEYGTKFRDYGTNLTQPYMYFDVIKQFDIYEFNLIPNGQMKTLDFKNLFSKINLEKYVNEFGVKEVWVCHFMKFDWESVKKNGDNDPSTYWSIEESNMSSPLTGDISNSVRNNTDLPIYNSSYVVYAHYGAAGAENNLHVRGHQIEAQLYYVDKSPITLDKRKLLFSDLFVGSGNGVNNLPLGRVGMTHFPPNTTVDYDYSNKSLIQSDIMDWIPDGGKKTQVNVDTWMKIKYPFKQSSRFTQKCGEQQCVVNYNDDAHFMWMMFWFQSIPGFSNKIPYLNSTLYNWWDIYFNWDDAIRNKKSLVN